MIVKEDGIYYYFNNGNGSIDLKLDDKNENIIYFSNFINKLYKSIHKKLKKIDIIIFY